MLKADFHIHTDSDPSDRVDYSNEEIIDLAAEKEYQVLAITNHDVVTFNDELSEYALERGILLLPGVELMVENKHVILINARSEHQSIRDFQELKAAREESLLIIAPHPFFPKSYCLNGKFEQNMESFDAVEFSHFYHPLINYNKKALRICNENGIPMVGSSDTHMIRQFNTTWTLVDAEKDPLSVVRAVRDGKVEVVTHPLSLRELAIVGYKITFQS
jgi:predicted metal-dependent phosphoesterase TrpH